MSDKKLIVYPALVVNDYENATYATWIKEGRKKIETRMGRFFQHRGDIVICCGKGKSVGPNAGKALCIVTITAGGPMEPAHEKDACIEYSPARNVLLLDNWRYFSRDFDFAPQAVKRNFQGIFSITIPDDVQIIPQPHIQPFKQNLHEIR